MDPRPILPNKIKTISLEGTAEFDKTVNKYLKKGWQIYSPFTYIPLPRTSYGEKGFYFVVLYK